MPKLIICDTSCLIILGKIGEFDLLRQLYINITTTVEIAAEYGAPLPDWVNIEPVIDESKQRLLEIQLDKGEASAIALALDMSDCTIILDDYKARKLAAQLGLNITGTLGVLTKAKLNGIIPAVKPLLQNKTDRF